MPRLKTTIFGFLILWYRSALIVKVSVYGKEGSAIYPETSQAPLPNPDLPEEIKNDFEEARSILNGSPRSAAALLRLCIQKLCAHLGESGKNITKDIDSLIKKGLNPKIQNNLDVIRVTGNKAVNPGMIDARDDFGTAVQLCQLINIIVDARITQPRRIDALNKQLSEAKRKLTRKNGKWDAKNSTNKER